MAETYKDLTTFLPKLQELAQEKDRTKNAEKSPDMTNAVGDEVADALVHAICLFEKSHPEYGLSRYGDILEKNGIEWGIQSMQYADVSKLDGQAVLALLTGAVRAKRFCDGALLSFFEAGCLEKWLKRLAELDEKVGE